MVALHLILELFDSVASFSVFLEFLPSEVVSIEELTFKEPDCLLIFLHSVNDFVKDSLVNVSNIEELGLDLKFLSGFMGELVTSFEHSFDLIFSFIDEELDLLRGFTGIVFVRDFKVSSDHVFEFLFFFDLFSVKVDCFSGNKYLLWL